MYPQNRVVYKLVFNSIIWPWRVTKNKMCYKQNFIILNMQQITVKKLKKILLRNQIW